MTATAEAPRTGLMTRVLVRLLRVVVGAVFVYAGAIKVFNPPEFAVAIENYRMVPLELVNLMAITLPWLEVIVGFLLIVGVWVRPSALIVTLLMIVFLIAIGQALARGLNIDCGCFGTQEGSKIGLRKLGENILLLAASGWLTWKAHN